MCHLNMFLISALILDSAQLLYCAKPTLTCTHEIMAVMVTDPRFLLQWVVNAVESQLFATAGESFSSLRHTLWNTLDEEITLQDCDIYRYYILI